ncbi:MAG TPA: hypothetical protein VIH89_08220 [Candidatus Sulfotelmatobacter sp.]
MTLNIIGPLSTKVEHSFRKLSAVASDLNFSSDELGKSVSELDAALKKLNLGISAWVTFRGNSDPNEGWYWNEELGYDKVGGTWGMALRTIKGSGDPEHDLVETWLFNDGPRSLRLSAIDAIPKLLEELSTNATETAKKIRLKLSEVQEVAAVVKKAAEEPLKRIIARGPEVPATGGNKK